MKRAAFQMDHPSRLTARTDSTFMLIEEAQARGIDCFFFTPLDLTMRGSELLARAQPIRVHAEGYTLGEAQHAPLHAADIVWMRQDPPFNMQYITATYLLEQLAGITRVVNDPFAVRNAPEKLSALRYAEFLPPTLISLDREEITAFVRTHTTVIAKPLHGYGGRGVFKFSAGDANIETLSEHWREIYGEPLMWQAFLPEVASKDTRVILINGAVACAFARIPTAGSIRANMRVGGTPQRTELSARQQAICAAIGTQCKAQGLLFVGLDLIGDYLTEINVTSPTGLRAAQTLYGINLAATLWDEAFTRA